MTARRPSARSARCCSPASRSCSLRSYETRYPALKSELLRAFADFVDQLVSEKAEQVVDEASAPRVLDAICLFHAQLDSRSAQEFLVRIVHYLSVDRAPALALNLQGVTSVLLKTLLCLFQGSLPASPALRRTVDALLPCALPHLSHVLAFANQLFRLNPGCEEAVIASPQIETFHLI